MIQKNSLIHFVGFFFVSSFYCLYGSASADNYLSGGQKRSVHFSASNQVVEIPARASLRVVEKVGSVREQNVPYKLPKSLLAYFKSGDVADLSKTHVVYSNIICDLLQQGYTKEPIKLFMEQFCGQQFSESSMNMIKLGQVYDAEYSKAAKDRQLQATLQQAVAPVASEDTVQQVPRPRVEGYDVPLCLRTEGIDFSCLSRR